MQYLDKLGWPVERVKGRWFLNFLRLLIHTRKIKTGSFTHTMANKPLENDAQTDARLN
jgi:hypothetical protein